MTAPPMSKVARELAPVQLLCCHKPRNLSALIPARLVHLVAADVVHRVGEGRGDVGEQRAEEVVRALEVDAQEAERVPRALGQQRAVA